MAHLKAAARRVAALPLRARLALVAAVVLSVVAVVLLTVPGGGDAGGGGGGESPEDAAVPPGGHGGSATSTTLATGGIEVDAPEGWQVLPLPDLGFGIAVPPAWEAVVLSAEGLETLSGAEPRIEGFIESAHAAARGGGLVYAAGEDDEGNVSDVLVRAAPETGVGDVDELVAYARELSDRSGITEPEVERVEGAALPTVRLRFSIGEDAGTATGDAEGEGDAGGEEAGEGAGTGDATVARGTETLVLADDGIVWSVIVTSDDPAAHDDLAARLTGTLAFAPG